MLKTNMNIKADDMPLETLPKETWSDLSALDPYEQAKKAEAEFNPETGFTVKFLGADYVLNPERKTVVTSAAHEPATFQKALILASYLTHAKNLGLSGRMIPPRDLKGGDFFFRGPHAVKTQPLIDKFGGNSKLLANRAILLGGIITDTKAAGCSFWWPVLPKIALALNFYERDDEFEAEAIYTIDAHAGDQVALDVLFALLNIATDELVYGL